MPQILTPGGYVDLFSVQAGDAVSAFDVGTGTPITNYIESVTLVGVDADAPYGTNTNNVLYLSTADLSAASTSA